MDPNNRNIAVMNRRRKIMKKHNTHQITIKTTQIRIKKEDIKQIV